MVTARGASRPRVAPSLIDQPGTAESDWRGWLPLRELPAADVAGWQRVLVVAAHPDDEVLGVGGLIGMLATARARLRLVAVTDGEASHRSVAEPTGLALRRAAETSAALRVLGAEAAEVIRLRLPDSALTAHEAALEDRLAELGEGFDVCLAPWEHDAHPDHEVAGRAARRACPRRFGYPVWAWHWARPGDPRLPWDRATQVPLPSAVARRKRAAIGCFASQLERRGAASPVLSPGTLAHFTRDLEVLLT